MRAEPRSTPPAQAHNRARSSSAGRALTILLFAAVVVVLAVNVAVRSAPRTSGDLVQLWLVPEADRGSMEVGLHNGVAVELDCRLTLTTGGDAVERQFLLEPGDTFREQPGGPAVAAPIDMARAECAGDGVDFVRTVWRNPEAAS